MNVVYTYLIGKIHILISECWRGACPNMFKLVEGEFLTGVLSVYLRSTHSLSEKLRMHYQSKLMRTLHNPKRLLIYYQRRLM